MILRGWKDIENYTGLSVKSIKKLMKEKENPIPIVKIAGKYMTTKQKYEEWLDKKIIVS